MVHFCQYFSVEKSQDYQAMVMGHRLHDLFVGGTLRSCCVQTEKVDGYISGGDVSRTRLVDVCLTRQS